MPPWYSTGSNHSDTVAGRRLHSATRLNARVDLLRLQTLRRDQYPYLLQSVSQSGSQARYDILCAFPQETITLNSVDTGAPDFLSILDQFTAEREILPATADDLPFVGGWFVYLGYELAAQIEPVLDIPGINADGLPVAFASHTPAAIINDHLLQCCFIVTQSGWQHLEREILRDIERSLHRPVPDGLIPEAEIREEIPEKYLQDIKRIKDYIRDGDVFQVNLSRSWELEFKKPLAAGTLYRRLCHHNPAPFAASVHHQDTAIISSSPERLFKVIGDSVETRPIAGTRPRHGESAQDHAYLQELLSHPKERAEHIMLIDLERNDLGRICRAGSVQVNELMVLESYAHVHHIVSNVQGKLQEAMTPGRLIRALFPGGTITGCPKIRCMQIIAELERTQRGPYTGAVGYISANGNMDFNILIRTLTLHGNRVKFRTGAGIVADSVPQRELDETRAKARGLLLALGLQA